MNNKIIKNQCHIDAVEDKIKRAVMLFFILLSLCCAGNSLFYFLIGFEIAMIFELMFFFFNLSWLVLTFKYGYEEIRLMARLYFGSATVLLFPLSVILYKEGVLTIFVYYALFPISNLLLYSVRSTVKCSIYTVILILASIVVSYYVEYDFELGKIYIDVLNFLNFTIFISLLFLFYFYLFKSMMKREDILKEVYNNEHRENGAFVMSDHENKEKYEKLYGEIIEYFEKQKPYASGDFRISLLADKLNSNTTYISNAIREGSGSNFNSLVNKYRIEYAKQMIRDGFLEKYSMTYIYTKAGFKYQSTFNEIFKKLEKITPREYVKNL
jgi:AraC-like DNA-binding protein